MRAVVVTALVVIVTRACMLRCGHGTCHCCRCHACMLWWWATALVVIATRACMHAVAVAMELIVVRLAHACML